MRSLISSNLLGGFCPKHEVSIRIYRYSFRLWLYVLIMFMYIDTLKLQGYLKTCVLYVYKTSCYLFCYCCCLWLL